MDLTVQQLRYFLAVAEELHFTRAAERLRVAPPSLSQQIAALERRMQVPLFRRTSRRVELTPAGADLVPLARRAVAALDDVHGWAARRRGDGERLTIGLVTGGQLCSAILAAAAAELPGVRWEVRRLGFAGYLDALRSGHVDVALVPLVGAPAVPGLRSVPLWSEGRVLVVAATHRLAGRADVGIEETNGERFVGAGVDEAAVADWFASPRADGSRPVVEPAASTLEEVLDLCSAGLGVNIAGATVVHDHARPDLRFLPVRDLPDVTVHLLRHPGDGTPAALERLAREVVRQQAAQVGARPA
ncbi:LysR family transcriptional regulator [Kineococcus glutinatus]|uniref:LysR substrate-binding domain-containing protein n=1 Tax=Kineococcus glutinatus TaxID=1070872 RepID=A0ABP9HYC9_9ACTN